MIVAPPVPVVLDERVVHDGWARFRIVRLRTRDGTIIQREVEDHGAAVAVLPYDPARRVAVVVTQMRPPVLVTTGETAVTEAPAGLLEEGEDPADCARREAMEEAGVRLGPLEPLGVVWSMPGLSTERMHLFLAPYGEADRIGDGGGLADEHEDITVEERPLPMLAADAEAGRLGDMKTLLLLMHLRLRRPDLFA